MSHIDIYTQNESVYVGDNIVLKIARVNEATGEVHLAVTAPPKRPIVGLERYLKTRLHEARQQYRKNINDLLKKIEINFKFNNYQNLKFDKARINCRT